MSDSKWNPHHMVIKDKAVTLRQERRDAWPRPSEVACECGGRAFQCGAGSTGYYCFRCKQSRTVWTGFDDPAWF